MAAAVAVAALTANAAMASVMFSGTNLSMQLSASATFTYLGGGQLEVTLANTYTGDTVDQAHVLTGVLFDISNTNLSPVSASASAGTVEWIGTVSNAAPSSAVLGTEWAYGTGKAPGGPSGIDAGIVSSGYYSPGNGNFGTTNGDMLDGSSYGILSAGYAGSDMDGLSNRQYLQPSMDFILSGFSGDLSSISDVNFQYGTSLSEPSLAGVVVPEPGAVALVGLGAAIVLILRRVKQRGLNLT
jgi:hypothetical protein